MLENADRLLNALCEMPMLDRQVIELRYLQDMSEREIGMLLGLSMNDVQTRLFRARWNLAQKLQSVNV